MALTLRLLGGLSTDEIARAFLVPEPTIAQRIVRAKTAAETDWARIVALYAILAALAPSPVVELNRAVAVGMASGPAAGLALVEALTNEPPLAGCHLLPSVRADFLAKLGRLAEARKEFERAAGLTRNVRERELLLARAAACTRESKSQEPRRTAARRPASLTCRRAP